MNIAFIGKYSDDQVNGVLNSGFLLAKALVEINVKVFFYYSDSTDQNFKDDQGIQHRVFKASRLNFDLPESFKHCLRNNSDEINVFHFHSVFILHHFSIARILSRQGFPFVVTPHGGYNIFSLERTLLRNTLLKKIYIQSIERYIVERAKGMIAVTQREQEDLRVFGVKTRIDVIPNTVTCPKKNELNVKKGKIVLLFLGRYDIQFKGLLFLLKTFKLINAVRKDVWLIMHGEGKDKVKLLRMVKDQRIDNIEIGEPVFGLAKMEALRNCTLYIQPSRSEAFGMSMAEAMSFAKPVVVTNESYLTPLLQQNDVGFTVPYQPNIAANKILEYLNDMNTLEGDGIKCRALVEREFHPKRVAHATLSFYRQVYLDSLPGSPVLNEINNGKIVDSKLYLNSFSTDAS